MKSNFYIIIFILLLLSCSGNQEKKKNNKVQNPHIEHIFEHIDWAETHYFLFSNFEENEDYIKYLFEFAKTKEGWRISIITDKKTFKFDDGALVYVDATKQRFAFIRPNRESPNNCFDFVKVNYLKSETVPFRKKQTDEQNSLYADFDSLNLNVIQNMLDFAEADSAKFHTDDYTYELYNKDNIKKVVIIYHDKGKWFEIEVL
jgi:lipopolysaccharide export LptBFGC system permease protein LptF